MAAVTGHWSFGSANPTETMSLESSAEIHTESNATAEADLLPARRNQSNERAWGRTGNGTAGTEAGFVLNGNSSKYQIVDTKSGNTQGYEKMTINLAGNSSGATFALFHVHPNNSGPYPSTPGNNKLGNNKGDTGSRTNTESPFYVISRRSLAV